jgi:hypothetical protein
MMSDSFEDRLRRAAGIPTTAEKLAQEESMATAQAEWTRNEPLRKQALERYTRSIVPVINACLSSAQKIVGELKVPLEIVESHMPLHSMVLAQRTFQLQYPPQRGPHQSRGARPSQTQFPKNVGTLHVTLAHTGELILEVPANPQIRQTPTQGVAIDKVDPVVIEEAFQRLLSRLKH